MVFTLTACIVLSGLVSFSRWVVDSERRSIERAEHADGQATIIGTMSGSDDALDDAAPAAGRLAIDATARADARAALRMARVAATGRATLLAAGPGQLGSTSSALIFVDGASDAPGVVSVASNARTWGAAVMGPSGTCYLLRFSSGDGLAYGTGGTCTGAHALGVASPSW
jgi:hypothetical protein